MNQDENTCYKTRKKDQPYEIWVNSDFSWQWFVLRKYQKPSLEIKNRYAKWFCAVRSPMTFDSFDIGDVYRDDIIENAEQIIGLHSFDRYQVVCFECGEKNKSFSFARFNPLRTEIDFIDSVCPICNRQLVDVHPTAKVIKYLDCFFSE